MLIEQIIELQLRGPEPEEIRLIFDVQLCYSKMIESLSESSTDDK